MANYQLETGKTEALLDENGDPIAVGSATVAIGDGGVVQPAELEGSMALQAVGTGTSEVIVTPNGSDPVSHNVTVVAAPFDWSVADA